MKFSYLCILSLVLMVFVIISEKAKQYKIAVVLKGLASLTFVILGFLGSKYCSDPDFAQKIVIGLVLGCIADVLLNLRFVFEKKGQLVFLVGILVFLSGHILYLLALISKVKLYYIGLAVGVVLTALLMSYILRIVTANIAFKVFGVFYVASVMLMTCVAWQYAFSNLTMGSLLFAAGAIFFLVSDVVLILNTFTKKTRFSMRIVNLSMYYAGQLMIALALQLL